MKIVQAPKLTILNSNVFIMIGEGGGGLLCLGLKICHGPRAMLIRPCSDFLDIMSRNFKKPVNTFLPSTDIVLALLCDGCSLSAKEWITRERTWSDKELVNKVAQGGFHIVPKSSPEGDFRLSFSFAETTFMKHWSPLQHKIMRSFKVKC